MTPADNRSVVPADVVHYVRGTAGGKNEKRTVVQELPLLIRVRGRSEYTIMRTPGNDRELVVGFLLSEGLIGGLDDLQLLQECVEVSDVIDVQIAGEGVGESRRNMIVNSSCGLCGQAGIEALIDSLKPVKGGIKVSEETLYAIPRHVREGQAMFKETGATHAAALFDAKGHIVVLREDIGRHNALDKSIGYALLSDTAVPELGVFLSGRTSLEMILKAGRARIGLVAAVSAPTAAAIRAAQRAGITLCGFVRGDEISVYTHPERIVE